MNKNRKTTQRNNYPSAFTPIRNKDINIPTHQRVPSKADFGTNLYDLPEGCEEIPGLKDFLVNKVIKPIEDLCKRSSVTLNDVQSQLKDFIKAIKINAHDVYGNSVKLHNANNDLESTLQQLKIKFNSKNASSTEWTNVLKEATKKLKNTEQELNQLKETHEKTEKNLNELKETYKQKENELKTKEKELTQLKETNSKTTEELKHLKETNEKTGKELKTKENELKKTKAELEKTQQLNKEQKNRISQLEKEAEENGTTIKKQGTDLTQLKETYKQKENELNETKSQLEKTKTDLTQLKETNEKTKTELKEKEENLKTKENELNETKSQLEKTKKLNKEQENQISTLEKNVNDKESALKETTKQANELKKNYETKEKELNDTKSQAETFLLISGNTNVTARKFSLIYFFAWVFSWLSSGCQNYVNRIRTIRTLNQKFDTLRASGNLQSNDVNFTENSGNKSIDSNSTKDNMSGIFELLDDFLPKLEGELFNKYACIYINMLNLYQHDTSIIFGKINQLNTPLMRNKRILGMLKKRLQASSNKNIINEEKVNNNDIHEKPYSATILNQMK